MSEVRREVKTYRVDRLCGACGVGLMHRDGSLLLTDPPQYPHQCSSCGARETYRIAYPYLDYEDVLVAT